MSLCLPRVLRPETDGTFRLQTDGRPLGALLALLDEAALSSVHTLVIDKTLSAKTVDAFAADPRLERIRDLRLIDLKLGGEAFAKLVQSPRLRALETLSLDGCDVGDTGLADIERAGLELRELRSIRGSLSEEAIVAFARSPAAAKLKRLDVTRALSSEALRDLVTSPQLGGLLSLGLLDTKLQAEDLAAFADASFTQLSKLDLSRNAIGSAALRTLGKAPFARSLRHLELRSTAVDDAVFEHLVKAGLDLEALVLTDAKVMGTSAHALAELTGLRELAVSGARKGAERGDGIAALAARLPALQSLELWTLAVTDLGAKELAAASLPALRRLVLSTNRISGGGAEALGRAPWLCQLEHLHLEAYPGDPKIGERGAIALASRGFPKLRSLRLRKQAIKDAGLRAILEAAPRLEELDVSDGELTADGFAQLATAPLASTMRDLDASFNPVGSAAARVIGSMLALRKLSLAGAGLTDADVVALASAAPSTLEDLTLSYNELSDVAIDALLPLTPQLSDLSASFRTATPEKKKELEAAMKPPKQGKAAKR